MRRLLVRTLKFLTTVVLGLALVSCGPGERSLPFIAKDPFASRALSNFSGTWAMKLKGTKDGCKLGLRGKSFASTILIVQNRKSVTLTIQGLPKAFKGTVNGSSLSTSGKYVVSGFTLTGTVKAKLAGARSIKLTSANLVIKSGKKSCTVVLSGSGKR